MIRDFLLPATDSGVYAPDLGWLVISMVALVLVRRRRDLVVFVAGVVVFTGALMALRTLH